MASKLLIPTASSYLQVEMANAVERLRLQNYISLVENENHRQQAIIRRKILTMKDRYKVIRDRQIQLIEKTSTQIRSLEAPRNGLDKMLLREVEVKQHRSALETLIDNHALPDSPKKAKAKKIRKDARNNMSTKFTNERNSNHHLRADIPKPYPLKKANSVEDLDVTGTHPEMLKLPSSAPKKRPQRDPIEQVVAVNHLGVGQKEKQSKARPFLTNLDTENSLVSAKIKSRTLDKHSRSNHQSKDDKEKNKSRISFPHLGTSHVENCDKAKVRRVKTTVERSRETLSEIVKSLPEYLTEEEKTNKAMKIFKKRKRSDERTEMAKLNEKISEYNKEMYNFTHPPQRSKWNRLKATVSIMRGFGLKLGNKNAPRGFAQRMGLRFR